MPVGLKEDRNTRIEVVSQKTDDAIKAVQTLLAREKEQEYWQEWQDAALVNYIDYKIKLMLDIAPGAERVTPSQLDKFITDEVGVQNVWEATTLLHNSKIEVFVPQSITLTDDVEAAIKRLNRNSASPDAVRRRYYAFGVQLKGMLDEAEPGDGVKRVVISESSLTGELSGISKSSPATFKDTRLINIALPTDYSQMCSEEKSICQGRMLMTALLARIYEKDKPMVEHLLKMLLKYQLDDPEAGAIDTFLANLVESSDEATDVSKIAKRINFFLGKVVSLVAQKAQELRMMKELWLYA